MGLVAVTSLLCVCVCVCVELASMEGGRSLLLVCVAVVAAMLLSTGESSKRGSETKHS